MAAAKRSGGKHGGLNPGDDGTGGGLDFLGDDDSGDDSSGDDGGGGGGDDTGGDDSSLDGMLGDDTAGDDTTGDDSSLDGLLGDDTAGDDTAGDDTTGDDTAVDTGDDTSGGGPWGDVWGPGGMHPTDGEGDDAALDSLVDYLSGDDTNTDLFDDSNGDPFDGLFDDDFDDDGLDDNSDDTNITVDDPCYIILNSENQSALDRLDQFTGFLSSVTGSTAQSIYGDAYELLGFIQDIGDAMSGDKITMIVNGIEKVLEGILASLHTGQKLQANFNAIRAGWLSSLNNAYQQLLNQSMIEVLSGQAVLPTPCAELLDQLTGGFGGLDGILADGSGGDDDMSGGIIAPRRPNPQGFVPISSVRLPPSIGMTPMSSPISMVGGIPVVLKRNITGQTGLPPVRVV